MFITNVRLAAGFVCLALILTGGVIYFFPHHTPGVQAQGASLQPDGGGKNPLKDVIGRKVKVVTPATHYFGKVARIEGSFIYLTDVQGLYFEKGPNDQLEGLLINTASSSVLRIEILKQKD